MQNRRAALALLCALAASHDALAAQATYPLKPVRVLIGSPAGSTADVLARPIAQRLSEHHGVQFVIDNRSGATGQIANDIVVKAAPDGYTLLMIPGSQISIVPHITPQLTYHPLRDFTPIMQTNAFGYALVVNAAVPAKSVKELLALARSKPGSMTFASSGTGSGFHLAGELFQALGKVQLLHVPYKGTPPALVDLIGGRVDMMFLALGLAHAHVKKGSLRVLAVTGAERDPLEPEVPTVAEAGVPGYETSGWHGMVGPARMPPDIVKTLNASLVKIMGTPEIREMWAKNGMTVVANTPQEFAARMRSDYEKYGKLIKTVGIKPER